MEMPILMCDHCGVCDDHACGQKLTPTGWEAKLGSQSWHSTFALKGWCRQPSFEAKARYIIALDPGLSDAQQIEAIYQMMESRFPFEETCANRYAVSDVARVYWRARRGGLTPHEKNQQFLDMFPPAHRPPVRQWLKEYQDADKDKLHPLRECAQEMFCAVVARAREFGDVKAADEILDYVLPHRGESLSADDTPIKDYEFDFLTSLSSGGSEGIYLSCFLDGNFGSGNKKLSVGTFKTLKEDAAAYKVMGELGGALTYHAQKYINEHLDRYTSDTELKARYGAAEKE